MMKKIFAFAFLFFVGIGIASAQISTPEEARRELQRRGLDEETVRQRLQEKGIDINSIDPGNAASMFKAQKALDEVMQDLNSEKITVPERIIQADTLKEEDKKIIAKQSEEVSKAVEEGSTLEEAVSETLTENQSSDLPDATIYGQEIFRSQSIKLYRQSKDVKPPDSYVLGVGDVIGLSIWGNSEESQVHEINADGYIKPAGIPRIYLKGIKYGEAKSLLRTRFNNYYNFGDNQFEVSLNFSRTINVSVVGEVYNFGSFNIPAINTAFNALVAAGGPNEIGSVRKIQLMRTGQQPRTIDIYKYLLNPSIGNDFYLEENDIINIPVHDKLVTINGAVNRPFKYELLANENLKDLITFARGFKPNAVKKNIQITRYENDEEKIIDINWIELSKRNSDFALKPGDRIRVNAIESNYNNYVSINGAVEGPGKYAFETGDKISDLLDKLEIRDGALLELSYLKRINDDNKSISYLKVNIQEVLNDRNSSSNILLKRGDALTIFSQGVFIDESTFTVSGAVRNGDKFSYDYDKSIRISDAIFLAGGLKNDAASFGYITRKDPTKPKQSQYIKVDIQSILEDINSPENIYLEAKDILNINSTIEFTDSLFISIEGYVRNPGRYNFDDSLNIEDVLLMSGGLRYEAAGNKIDIYRVDINDENKTKTVVANVEVDENLKIKGKKFVLKPFDEIVVRRAPEFSLQRNVFIKGDVKYPGKYAIINENERISELVKRAGGLTQEASVDGITIERDDGTGFIVSDYKKALENPGSAEDIILKAGDKINIPKLENLVTISGATTANELLRSNGGNFLTVSVPFEKGKNAKYYIEKYAAGISEKGSTNKITVTEANGRVKTMDRFLFFKIYPKVGRGARIHVGTEPVKIETKTEGEKTDWGEVFASSVAQATSVLTLILLIQRLD